MVFAGSTGPSRLSRPRLERATGLSRVELNAALDELTRAGMLDVQRLRLTLPGLAVAVAVGARVAAEEPAVAPKARPKSSAVAPIALFYQREAPRAVA
jgi:hypothetical protein